MRFVGVAAIAALIGLAAVPARAQMGGDGPHINLLSDLPSKTPDQIEAEQERDKKYKDSLKKIPDAKASNDPWGSVRSDAPKTSRETATTKTPAKKTKTGSTQN
jgi:hypothetical protein